MDPVIVVGGFRVSPELVVGGDAGCIRSHDGHDPHFTKAAKALKGLEGCIVLSCLSWDLTVPGKSG